MVTKSVFGVGGKQGPPPLPTIERSALIPSVKKLFAATIEELRTDVKSTTESVPQKMTEP
jgi:hypothetical protein